MNMRRNFVREGGFWLGALDVVCLVLAVVVGITARGVIGPRMGLSVADYTFIDYVRGHIDGWFFFCAAIVVAGVIPAASPYAVDRSLSAVPATASFMC